MAFSKLSEKLQQRLVSSVSRHQRQMSPLFKLPEAAKDIIWQYVFENVRIKAATVPDKPRRWRHKIFSVDHHPVQLRWSVRTCVMEADSREPDERLVRRAEKRTKRPAKPKRTLAMLLVSKRHYSEIHAAMLKHSWRYPKPITSSNRK